MYNSINTLSRNILIKTTKMMKLVEKNQCIIVRTLIDKYKHTEIDECLLYIA